MNDDLKGDAIIAISERGAGFLIKWLSKDSVKTQLVFEGECTPDECDFCGKQAGVYYAKFETFGCSGGKHHYGCEGDCFNFEWILGQSIVEFF